MAKLEISVETDEAVKQVEEWLDDLDVAAEDALDTLQTMAETSMKAEAPTGAGKPAMRNTITTRNIGEHKRETQPRKRTPEGWLLHRAIVGNPSTPSYTDTKPAVWVGAGGQAQGQLAEWTRAKLGDRNAAWAVAQNILERGTQESFPDRFIDRALKSWINDVERQAGDAVAEAFRK
jgi:hypothetical protein